MLLRGRVCVGSAPGTLSQAAVDECCTKASRIRGSRLYAGAQRHTKYRCRTEFISYWRVLRFALPQ
jgi:hypothetical protein